MQLVLSSVLLMSLWCSSAAADELATSESGQRVLLRDNGTWVIVTAPPQSNTLPPEAVLKQKCSEQWQTDFRMQAHCIQQEREAVIKLNRGKPADISPGQFSVVRSSCAAQWPTEFRMREFCEQQQYQGIRSLR